MTLDWIDDHIPDPPRNETTGPPGIQHAAAITPPRDRHSDLVLKLSSARETELACNKSEEGRRDGPLT